MPVWPPTDGTNEGDEATGGFRRRDLFKDGAVATATLLVGAGAWDSAVAFGQSVELSDRRTAVFAAVLEALGKSSSSFVDSDRADAVLQKLRGEYRAGDVGFRSNIDWILDAIEPASHQGEFSNKNSSDRLRELRRRRQNADSGRVKGQPDSFFIDSVVGIASLPFINPRLRMQPYDVPI
jgi:hypothetical protein